jgi:hypothetical protein
MSKQNQSNLTTSNQQTIACSSNNIRFVLQGQRSYRFVLQEQNREERRRDKLTLLAVDDLLQGMSSPSMSCGRGMEGMEVACRL